MKKRYYAGILIILAALAFFLAFHLMEPAPPDRIRIATGESTGAYALFGEEYRKRLSKEGLIVELVPSSGAIENLHLLLERKVDIAFSQGGVAKSVEDPRGILRSLAAIYTEPLWVFTRTSAPLRRLYNLQGETIAIGAKGSGTEAVARVLLEANGVNDTNSRLLSLTQEEAAAGLLENRVRAVFLIASHQSPVVEKLINAPDIKLMNFERYAAYTSQIPFIRSLVLPQGVLSLRKDLPPRELTLAATSAMLVARDDIHPQVVARILTLAREIHSGRGLLVEPGKYPNGTDVDLPLDDAAETFLDSETSILERFLPYSWIRFLYLGRLLLIPSLVFLLPLFKIFPAVYRWLKVSRVLYRSYEALRDIEKEKRERGGNALTSEEEHRWRTAVEAVERITASVPGSMLDQIHQFHLHAEHLKRRLEEGTGASRG